MMHGRKNIKLNNGEGYIQFDWRFEKIWFYVCVSVHQKSILYNILILYRLWHSAVDNRPWTSILDIYHPDPWHAPVAVTTVIVLLMMDAESVRNFQSDLAVTNKQYCQSCILLVLYTIKDLMSLVWRFKTDTNKLTKATRNHEQT